MNSLYAIFFLVAVILFAAIVGISWWQQKAKTEGLGIRSRRKSKESSAGEPILDDDPVDIIGAPNRLEKESELGHANIELKPHSSMNDNSRTAPDLNDSPESEPLKAVESPAENSAEINAFDGNETSSSEPLAPTFEPTLANTSAQNLSNGPDRNSASAQLGAGSGLITDLVARVQNTEPIEQHDLLMLFREYDFKFDRKVHIYGLNQMTDIWCDIEYELPSARFVELGVSIQLADTRGAMTEKESHDFQQMALELTNRFNATFEFSMDLDAAVEQAQLLDRIGRRFDSMAVLNVVPKSKTGFRVADVESCARDLMMSTDKNGIFMKTQGHKDALEVLYRLACTDGEGQFGIAGAGANSAPVHDLVIYMNVPATNQPDVVFQEMIQDANSLATWLDGRVVDRNGRAVSQRSYTALMNQIIDISDGMHAEGLMPGDVVSRKLF